MIFKIVLALFIFFYILPIVSNMLLVLIMFIVTIPTFIILRIKDMFSREEVH